MTANPMEIDMNQGTSDRRRVEILGRVVDSRAKERFKDLVRRCISQGVVDITHWTLDAIEGLLIVCSDKGSIITLKQGDRYFMLASNPSASDVPLLSRVIFEGRI